MALPSASYYPQDISREIRHRWCQSHPPEFLLTDEQLEHLLDTTYQASLLREEGDAIRCRVIIGSPADFEDCVGIGSQGLFVLRFRDDCPFVPHEIRKLAGAAGYYRSMLAVEYPEAGTPRIWGMIVTGTRWVNRIEGGRFSGYPLPPHMVIQVVSPGHLVVASGYTRVLETAGGQLLTEGFDPFHSQWLPEKFGHIRSALLQELDETITVPGRTRICDSFVKNVAQSVVRRVLSIVRTRGHGGMLIYLPDGAVDKDFSCHLFRFRVTFEREPSTLRFRRLMSLLLRRLQVVGEELRLKTVTWEDYQKMEDPELSNLDDALIEFANVLADFMSVDGALVLDRGFRTIGFGGEILGDTHVSIVHRALDLEAEQTLPEPAANSGTRHRSAYRLVSSLPDAIAVVVSQDGAIRFVAHHKQKLTYWPYLP